MALSSSSVDRVCGDGPETAAKLIASSLRPGEHRADGLSSLTVRERDVLTLIAEDGSNGAIAATLVVSERAVEKHVANIFSREP